MKFGSVCSGIEAASMAFNPLGWKAQWFSEIEPFPCSVLKHHYPDTPNLGDMTKYNDWPTDDKHAIDLLCGGTPCQSFSVAGLRKGLDDPRGNLMLTFGAIAAKYRPQWLVWENVPGVLSSNGGRDFGSFLGMLGQLGYGFAYRICDAQYHGVAQRRRRVFVVGCLGDWRSAAAVLFERHSLQGNPAPRRKAGQTVTPTIRAGASNGGPGHGARSGDSKDELIVPGAKSLRGQPNASNREDSDTYIPVFEVAGTMKACKDSGGWSNSADNAAAGCMIPVQIVETLCVATGQAGAEICAEICAEMAPTLNCNHEAPYAMYPVPFDTTQITSKANYSNPKAGDPCHPLAAQAHVPCIAFPERMSGTQCASTENLAPSMGALNPTAVAVSLRGREGGATAELGDEVGNCLRASGGGGDKAHVLTAMQVRRLTPEECEALQGFPEVRRNVKISVCFDHPNPSVPAETQCPKSPSNARSAGRAGSPQSANAAGQNSSKSLQTGIAPVAVNVQIDLGRMHLQLHSAGKLLLSVSLAESQSRYPLFTQLGNIAQELAKVLANLERTATAGRAASHPHINPSSAQLNGSPSVELSGQEIDAFANDAETFAAQASAFTKSITSQAGQSSLSCSETLRTLCCFAMAAISSCIQEKTNWASSYEISVEVAQGYTAIPWRGKPADQCPDGPRYKSLGNSWAIPCVSWIGKRIKEVQAIHIKSKLLEAA